MIKRICDRVRGENNMTYAMTLDNSWELMSEEEMYDVNVGGNFMRKVWILAGITFISTLLVGIVLENVFKDLNDIILVISMAIVSVGAVIIGSIKIKDKI